MRGTEQRDQQIDPDSEKRYLNEKLQELQDRFAEVTKKPARKRRAKPGRQDRGRALLLMDRGTDEGNIDTSMTQEGVQQIQTSNRGPCALGKANERAGEHANGSRPARWAALSTTQNSDGQGCGIGNPNNSLSFSKNRTKASNKPLQSLYLQTLETHAHQKSTAHRSSKVHLTTMHQQSHKNSFLKNQSFVSHISSSKPGYGGSESKRNRYQIQASQDKGAAQT